MPDPLALNGKRVNRGVVLLVKPKRAGPYRSPVRRASPYRSHLCEGPAHAGHLSPMGRPIPVPCLNRAELVQNNQALAAQFKLDIHRPPSGEGDLVGFLVGLVIRAREEP